MDTGRLEAFSDGVLAIIITIMVLELKIPHGVELSDLRPLLPVLLTYILSFIHVGIYWNNHHHLFQAVSTVNGSILWANLFLLFALSLLPFTTAWLGENKFSEMPVLLYGFILLLSAVAWKILVFFIVRGCGNEKVAKTLSHDRRMYITIGAYIVACLLALIYPVVSCAIYVILAALWFIPDRRMERSVENDKYNGEKHIKKDVGGT